MQCVDNTTDRRRLLNPECPMQGVKNTEISSIEALAHSWLMKWAKWARHGTGLGYPRRWVTERAREGGILAGSPRPPTSMPDDMAAIDRAVARLGNRHRSVIARALLLEYLDDSPKEKKAIWCGKSLSGYDGLVRRGQRNVYAQVISLGNTLQKYG